MRRDPLELSATLRLRLLDAARGCEAEVTVERQDRCGTCGGSGWFARACEGCGGVGRRATASGRDAPGSGGGGVAATSDACPVCLGRTPPWSVPCRPCGGTGREAREAVERVRLPPGARDGDELRLPRLGHVDGDRRGALRVVVALDGVCDVERAGGELHAAVRVAERVARDGGVVRVATDDGDHSVRIPPGTRHGARLRVASVQEAAAHHPFRGGPDARDLVVHVLVDGRGDGPPEPPWWAPLGVWWWRLVAWLRRQGGSRT